MDELKCPCGLRNHMDSEDCRKTLCCDCCPLQKKEEKVIRPGRLTLPHHGGKGHYMKCSEQLGCSGKCEDCEDLDALVDRLAAYEDTGLEPDQIEAVINGQITLQKSLEEKEKIVVQLREQWQAAELFICKLCVQFDWQEVDGLICGTKKCGRVAGIPFCDEFVCRRPNVSDINVGHTIPVNDLYDEDGADVMKGGPHEA